MARQRHDTRRESTRAALIEKAEILIAEQGVKAVSARQVGAAIGSANNNVVAYHFGNMEELIAAIYHHRLPAIEARRRELLDALEQQEPTVKSLLNALWRPLFEQRDANGKHSYAAFLASIARSGWMWTRYSLGEDYQVVNHIVTRMGHLIPPAVQAQFHRRLTITAAMITNTLSIMDAGEQDPEADEIAFQDLLTMSAAALTSLGEAA